MDLQRRCVEYFQSLQDNICSALSSLDGNPFREDLWEHHQQGGGRTRVLAAGRVFEKAGVNFSNVSGEFPETFAATMPGEGRSFTATGISLVLHPWNPKVPTVHANFRFITKGEAGWFGGGADLTPYYPYMEDCVAFHRVWRDVCDRHPSVASYPRFKEECDKYFFLPHRNETRGIGGIFFDYLRTESEPTFSFVRDAGDHFLAAYLPIAEKRCEEKFNEAERDFLLWRRGRYVEFNLIYDRGTIFGLKTNGRTESILMSLPLNVRWLYDYQPPTGSREAELIHYLKPRAWLDEAEKLGIAP